MNEPGTVVVVGGTCDLGKQLGSHYASRGHPVVLTSRDVSRAERAAEDIGSMAAGRSLDLTKPSEIASALAGVEDVSRLALVAVDRDENRVREYDAARAISLVTMKLVGYTEVVHVLAPRMHQRASIVLFGGLAKDRPYPGSTTITTINGGVTALVRTLAVELAPMRVNALHPAVVGDSAYWSQKPKATLDNLRARTPLGELVTVADVVDAAVFLLENPAVTGINLRVDGGWLLT